MGLKTFVKKKLVQQLLEEVPMIAKLAAWLTDPNVLGRKRTLTAILAVIAGMLNGMSSAFQGACDTAAFVGAICNFNAGGVADIVNQVIQTLDLFTPGVEITAAILGAFALWSAKKKTGKVIPVIIFCLIGASATAQTTSCLDTETCSVTATLSSGGTRFYTPGKFDKTELEGQLQVEVKLPEKLIAEGFARFTRTQGVDESQTLFEVATFRSINAELGLRLNIRPSVDAICSSGVSWERDKEFVPTDTNVWEVGCGVNVYVKKKFSISSKWGHSGSVNGAATFGKVVYYQSSRARFVATYTIPLNAVQFKQNPGAFTSGVQLDVYTKGK